MKWASLKKQAEALPANNILVDPKRTAVAFSSLKLLKSIKMEVKFLI